MSAVTPYNLCLKIAYDGTHFLGWQKTSFGRSIEEELEKALFQLLQHPVQLQAASRTDAGVHAEGQIVNFFTSSRRYPLSELLYRLNKLLPSDISVLEIHEMPPDFHPTLLCIKKTYRYSLSLGLYQLPHKRYYAWHFAYPLNLDKIEQASKWLLGKHDFSAFCNDKSKTLKDPICTLESITIEQTSAEDVDLYITGDRFLYKMVRNIVGTLVYIGSNKLPEQLLKEGIEGKKREHLGITAPAHGLSLYKVHYS